VGAAQHAQQGGQVGAGAQRLPGTTNTADGGGGGGASKEPELRLRDVSS
jgi:hypothetical protein